MGYDLRDFVFECAKEYTKRGFQYNIRQQCNEMRKRAMTIPKEHQNKTLAYINAVEQKQLQNVEMKVMETSVAKEILKMMGVIN